MAVDSIDVKIVPTILTADPAEFQRQMAAYTQFAKRVQIDVVDGSFVGTTTLMPAQLSALPPETEIDFHLMVARPSEQLAHVLRLKPSLCILHAEAGEDILPVMAQLKEAGIKTGVALLPSSYPGDFMKAVQAAQHILIFAGELGKQGGDADMLQIEKVKLVRKLNPGAEIGWDGGVNLENTRALAHADINVLNVGSYLSRAQDPAKAYQALLEEKNQRGVRL